MEVTLAVSRGVNRELQIYVTQRSVLSFVLSVFNPIGLLAPHTTIRARLFLKYIWRITGQQWDPPNQMRSGSTCLSLFVLGELVDPRCYFNNPFDNCKLHMFADNSQDVFCAVDFFLPGLL